MVAKAELQELVAGFSGAGLADAAERAKRGDELGEAQTLAALIWAAVCCPAGVRPVYNAIVAAWFGGPLEDSSSDVARAPLPDAFWDEFWPAVDCARTVTYTPATSTARIAAFTQHTHPEFLALAEQCEKRDGLINDLNSYIEPDVWESCPPDSLGYTLREMVAANAYDLAIGEKRELRVLPPKVARVNAHVNQFDGVWRAVAGYESVDSHLIAFAAFSLAQAGHLFSANALAFFAAIAHLVIPDSFGILMRLIAEGWRHGVWTPSLLGIDWRKLWGEPTTLVRARLAAAPYTSAYTKKLFYVLPRFAPD